MVFSGSEEFMKRRVDQIWPASAHLFFEGILSDGIQNSEIVRQIQTNSDKFRHFQKSSDRIPDSFFFQFERLSMHRACTRLHSLKVPDDDANHKSQISNLIKMGVSEHTDTLHRTASPWSPLNAKLQNLYC